MQEGRKSAEAGPTSNDVSLYKCHQKRGPLPNDRKRDVRPGPSFLRVRRIVLEQLCYRFVEILLLLFGLCLFVESFAYDTAPHQAVILRVVHVDCKLASMNRAGFAIRVASVPAPPIPSRTISPICVV